MFPPPLVPLGFRRLPWRDARPGQTVWLLGARCDKPYAYGPHTVQDLEHRKLRNSRGDVFMHYPEALLVEA